MTATHDGPEDDKPMPLLDHLIELRKRLIYALISFLAVFFITFYFNNRHAANIGIIFRDRTDLISVFIKTDRGLDLLFKPTSKYENACRFHLCYHCAS